jgi:hypothetical protein
MLMVRGCITRTSQLASGTMLTYVDLHRKNSNFGHDNNSVVRHDRGVKGEF